MKNTQKITRKDLQAIYKSSDICEKWKKEIADLVIFSEEKEIEVDNELINKAYSEANSTQKKLVEKYFKIVDNDIFSVTTIKEVCKRLEEKELTIKDFSNFGDLALKMLTFHQIKLLEKFFNQGWTADFNNSNQYKWYPYFEKVSGGYRFCSSSYHVSFFYGFVALYKDQKTSDHIGRNFKDIYLNLL